jgi:hypothetical protein
VPVAPVAPAEPPQEEDYAEYIDPGDEVPDDDSEAFNSDDYNGVTPTGSDEEYGF